MNYARWGVVTERTLDRSQIIAGTTTTAGANWIITWVRWAATNGATGAASATQETSGAAFTWGYQGPAALRMWGDVTASPPGPEYTACSNTGIAITNDHSDATEQQLSSISLQSGLRAGPRPANRQSPDWDPYAHVFAPTDAGRDR